MGPCIDSDIALNIIINGNAFHDCYEFRDKSLIRRILRAIIDISNILKYYITFLINRRMIIMITEELEIAFSNGFLYFNSICSLFLHLLDDWRSLMERTCLKALNTLSIKSLYRCIFNTYFDLLSLIKSNNLSIFSISDLPMILYLICLSLRNNIRSLFACLIINWFGLNDLIEDESTELFSFVWLIWYYSHLIENQNQLIIKKGV